MCEQDGVHYIIDRVFIMSVLNIIDRVYIMSVLKWLFSLAGGFRRSSGV